MKKLKNGSILCGGVGTGKSRTALAYYYFVVCQGSRPVNGNGGYSPMKAKRPLYVITTARKRDSLDWQDEASDFGLSTNPDISEAPMIIDSWNNIRKYTDVKGAFFIFDEQRVIGSGAWSKAFIKISKSNQWILATATPGDTWMDYIPVFVANGFYRNKTEFIKRHVVYSRFTKYPKVERYLGTAALKKLRDDIIVDMDYQKLTAPHHRNIFVDYDRTLYDVAKRRWDPYKEEPIRDGGALCYIYRKVVNSHPSRLDAIEELSKKHPRMIIFYNFDYELEMLRTLDKRLHIFVAEWNGHNHEEVPTCDRWLYLVQYTAGAEAWNCVTTDTIVFFSQNYSYKIMEQSSGRIDRLNTPYSNLYYYHLLSRAPIDRDISLALDRKETFSESRFLESEVSQKKHGLL